MSSEPAVRVTDLAKSYHLFASPRDRLKQLVFGRHRRYYHEFWALTDISFEVPRGETFGIIGRNGSGKSTLLQIVCGTLTPSRGSVHAGGRVAAMLELGAGFNPEFTGRENVFLNGHILGLTQKEIESRYEAICRFADIGEFIDQPVKTYSSGMQVRLAFAVMAHVDADVLVIDEALAVGDALFTQKCMRFLRAFKERGTLLFVSHDTTAVTSLCDRALWLDGGRVRRLGTSKKVCEAYLEHLFDSSGEGRSVAAAGNAGVEAIDRKNAIASDPATGRPVPRTGPEHGVVLPVAAAAPPDARRDARLDLVNTTVWRNDIELFEFDPKAASFGRRGAAVLAVGLSDARRRPLAWAVGGESVVLSIDIEARSALTRPIVGFFVRDRLGQNLFGDNTFLVDAAGGPLAPGERLRAEFEFDLPLLPPGDYSIAAAVADGNQHEIVQHEWIHDALLFRVETSSIRHSLVGLPMRAIQCTRLPPAPTAFTSER